MTDFTWSWVEHFRDLGEDEDGKPIREWGEIRRGKEIITPTPGEDGEENIITYERLWCPDEGPAIPVPLEKAGRIKKSIRSSVVKLTEGGLPCQQRKVMELEKKIMASRDDEVLSKLCEEMARIPILQEQPQYTEEVAARRLRRHYRKNMKRKLGWYSHNLFLIGRDGEKHSSPEMIAAREGQLSRANDWLSRTTAKTEHGEFNLLELAAKGKKQRYAETWARLKGMEKLARERKLIPIFYTATAKPHLHPNPEFGGQAWDGSLPDESVKFLSGAFATLRAGLMKEEVTLVGCRFPESHKDGCAHAHGLLWVHPLDLSTVLGEIKKIWHWHKKAFELKFLDGIPDGIDIPEDFLPDPDGTEDCEKASPSSYCMKYLTKTFNLAPGETDSHETWLSTWGGRACDWFGLPPTGLWRALRALKPAQIESG
ncbi:replication endonuclease, partial [Ferrovum sp.]|uniref:replication endonuclease n=1 Tax=Ferrovum sp. TaxID=2609467 RepID=UPI00261984F2